MCIILGPVKTVAETKIFVCPSLDKKRQLTMYQNTVDTKEKNMMILPVPHADSLTLHNIRGRKTLFEELRKSVRKIPQRSMYMMRSLEASCSLSFHDTLEVIDYGSYLVSIAPTFMDLFRLDSSIFEVPQSMFQFFADHYNEEFGYLCCVLKPGKQNYEPVVYSHPLHSSGKLFVPTMHYHVHEHGSQDTKQTADWDHLIYSCGTTKEANYDYFSLEENQVKWNRLPLEFQHKKEEPIRCAGIDGFHKNEDLAFVLA